MIKIRCLYKQAVDIDDNGAQIVTQIVEPETLIPSNAVKVECDGEFYTVHEQAD